MTISSLAISVRSLALRYFLFSNIFSSSKICLPVNVVRAFFFRRASVEPESESSSVVSNVLFALLCICAFTLLPGELLLLAINLSRIKLSLLPVGLISGGRATVDDSFFFLAAGLPELSAKVMEKNKGIQ